MMIKINTTTITNVSKYLSNVVFAASIILVALVVANRFLGQRAIKIYVVTSGSMEPAIKTGSIVGVVPQPDYAQGDVVTYRSSPKTTTTHRIVVKGDNIFYIAGDANKTFDTAHPTNSDIVGKVFFTIPYIGFLIGYSKTPQGFILLAIVPATIIIYEELKSVVKMLSGFFEKFTPKPMIVVPVIGALMVVVSLTGAYFYDKSVSHDNIITVAAPSPSPSPTPTPEILTNTP